VHPDWPVTAYVRSTKPENELKATLKADRVVIGDFNDIEKISTLSKEHDIAVNAGSSFTGDLVAAIIAGQKARANGPKGKLIHISGAGNFIDFGKSGNSNPESKVWNDANEEDIRSVHKDMFNGQSDILVLEAGAEAAVDTYVVCPSVVYGGASISAPTGGVGYSLVAGNAKSLGYVPYIGDGTAVISTVIHPPNPSAPFELLLNTSTDPHPRPHRLPRQDHRRRGRRTRTRNRIQSLLSSRDRQSPMEGSSDRTGKGHACTGFRFEPGTKASAIRASWPRRNSCWGKPTSQR
jgi:hypothetical protein